MPWTERQKDAIESRNETLLVSAAAGSGKTAVLVERVMGLIMNDRVGLDRMLIVTFTNAAAAEMKEKIGTRIRRSLQKDDLSPEDRRFLRSQLAAMGSCNISTFHKFAIEVVHRYYHIIGVSPDLAVCDESRAEILKREAMDELFEERFASGDGELRFFLDRYSGSRSDEEARNMILGFRDVMMSLPEPEEWMKSLEDGTLLDAEVFGGMVRDIISRSLDDAKLMLREAGRLLREGPADVGLPPAFSYAEKNAADISAVDSMKDALLRSPEEAVSMAAGCRFMTMSGKNADKPSWEYVRERVQALRKEAKALIGDMTDMLEGYTDGLLEKEKEAMLPVLRTLCSLTSDFDRRFAGKKAARGLMDFSDIEHMALRILKNGEVSAEYKKRFACAFIDEYQDSNMVQESLISRVCEPDRIFMVGDVKQSIYKFRLAEPELFLEKYKAMKAGQLTGRVIDLNANFRSKAGVIELVNRLFSKVMNAESCGIVYDEDAALIEGAPYKGPLIYRPRLYIAGPGEAPEEEELDEEIEDIRTAELEALQAAHIISSYIGRPIRDTRTGAERPLKYRDMALLMPAVKNKGEIFYRCLAAAGIPVYLARTEGYFDTLEVGVFLNLLRVIDNGRNDVPLISVLHFPAFGFSSEDLAEIRIFSNHSEEGKKKRPYSEALRLYAREGRDEALRTRCSDFLSKVAAWRRDASYAPLGLFVWRLLSSSGILDCCSALPGGLQRQANLRALADKAESFERESASGLYGFISYVDSVKDKVDTGEAEIFTEDSDAVRIMTIHKSKGLEFPFVLVCGMERSFSRGGRASKLAVHKKLGAGLVLADPATGLRNKTLIYRLISMQNRSEERAEKIRLLYVAATRAKDILIFSAAGKNLEKSWAAMRQQVLEPGRYEKSFLGLLASAFTAESDVIFTKQSVLEDPSATGETGALRKALEQGFELSGGEAPIPDLDERLAFKPSSAEAGEKTKFTVSQLAEIERLGAEGILKEQSFAEDFRPPLFIAPASSLGAAERGTAYHRVMEHLPFDRGELDASEILERMKNMEASGILSPAELAAVDPGRVAAFFRSPIGKRVLSSEKVMKEAPFTVKREYGGRTVLVQGTLDCCFMEDGSWVLVDYKSNYIDRASEEEEMERLRRTYLPQLSEYRYALKTVTGIPVKEAVLYLFGPGKELVIE